MRLASLAVLLLLAACAGTYSSAGIGDQNAQVPPSMGNDAQRDGFYDGGIYDPDLTRRNLPLPE